MPAKHRVHNFNAGPAALPLPVLEAIENDLYDWNHLGMSLMELSHRSEEFMEMASECDRNFRELLNIPKDYHILFLPGGGRLQFAMIPLNFAANHANAAYVDIGVWGHLAINEAKNLTTVKVVADAQSNNYTKIPDRNTWEDFSQAAYLYYVDNETVNGLEFNYIPETHGVPLICDMSSNILSREFDVKKFDLIFACAQKNLGIAGVTAVIVHNQFFDRIPATHTPSMLRYSLHAAENSLLNTPPTFPWYVVNEMLKWVKSEGGVPVMQARSAVKSGKLYQFIDSHEFYSNPIFPQDRSRMNVIFFLRNKELEKKFFEEAARANITGIKGHRALGGARVSLYNSITEASVDALINFMDDFAKKNA